MRVGIVGSRNFKDYDLLKKYMEGLKKELKCQYTEVISGGAKGADTLAEQYAIEKGIPLAVFKANWKDLTEPCIIKQNAYGKYNALAGFNRNLQIIENSDVIIAFWDMKSKGTKHTIDTAKKENKPVYICNIIKN